MNFIERTVYNYVKNNPVLKNKIRDIYQGFFDCLPKKKVYSKSELFIKEGYFLGFHDIQPFSNDSTKILANKVNIDFKMPSENDEMSVGYFNFDRKKGFLDYVEIGNTFAWNYHKGCRLQWCGTKNEYIIYNFYNKEKDKISSIKYNAEVKENFLLDWPIDTVNFKGNLASSFSYERLQKCMPGYGYCFSDEDSFIEENCPDLTGVFIVDLINNKRELLYSLKYLADTFVSNEFNVLESYHFVTHSQFSHDGRYLSFFHRIIFDDDKLSYTRLLIHDFENNSMLEVPTKGMVSHYKWNDANQIIAYSRLEDYDCHALVSMDDIGNIKTVAYPTINSDGHQSFINNQCFVTDTYADKYRMSKIYKVNIEDNSAEVIVSVHSPKQFQTVDVNRHIACDLHPRVSGDGKLLCFDTVTTGKRSLAVMEL